VRGSFYYQGYGTLEKKPNSRPGSSIYSNNETKLSTKKEDFLSSTNNKAQFILQLGSFLEMNGIVVRHAPGDADLLIVETAIKISRKKATVVIGEDTDLLILLLHHLPDCGHKAVYFQSEPKKSVTGKAWNIKEIKQKLGATVCDDLLFAHAISGCDTTLRVHGFGKGAALNKLA